MVKFGVEVGRRVLVEEREVGWIEVLGVAHHLREDQQRGTVEAGAPEPPEANSEEIRRTRRPERPTYPKG